MRWEFAPLAEPRDKSIRWKWHAYTQTGKLALQSEKSFDTLTECMANAKSYGYGQT